MSRKCRSESSFPTAFLLSSTYSATLATHISRKPVSVNLGSVSPKNRELRLYGTSRQEAQSLLLLCRLEAAASNVLQCLQPLFPAAVLGGSHTFQPGLCFGMAPLLAPPSLSSYLSVTSRSLMLQMSSHAFAQGC